MSGGAGKEADEEEVPEAAVEEVGAETEKEGPEAPVEKEAETVEVVEEAAEKVEEAGEGRGKGGESQNLQRHGGDKTGSRQGWVGPPTGRVARTDHIEAEGLCGAPRGRPTRDWKPGVTRGCPGSGP